MCYYVQLEVLPPTKEEMDKEEQSKDGSLSEAWRARLIEGSDLLSSLNNLASITSAHHHH